MGGWVDITVVGTVNCSCGLGAYLHMLCSCTAQSWGTLKSPLAVCMQCGLHARTTYSRFKAVPLPTKQDDMCTACPTLLMSASTKCPMVMRLGMA